MSEETFKSLTLKRQVPRIRCSDTAAANDSNRIALGYPRLTGIKTLTSLDDLH